MVKNPLSDIVSIILVKCHNHFYEQVNAGYEVAIIVQSSFTYGRKDDVYST